MSVLASISLGAVAGLGASPHCLAMCGPVASACASSRTASGAYLAARIVAYAVLGALVAGIAAPVIDLLPSSFASLLLGVTMSVALLASAARLARSPRSEATRPDVPVAQILRRRANGARDVGVAAFLGLGTGLLPCGALYSGLLLAGGTGSAADGALAMATFGLTSSAALLGAGAVAQRIGRAKGNVRQVLAAVLIAGAMLVVVRPIVAIATQDVACHG